MATRKRPGLHRELRMELLDCRVVPAAPGNSYLETVLVSDQATAGALTDPNLINPWGLTIGTPSNFWISDNGSDKSSIYSGDVGGTDLTINSLVVDVPGGPTGTVFNNSGDFVVTNGADSGPSIFIFGTQEGQIVGWNPAVPAPAPSSAGQVAATVADAVFTGLALGSTTDGNFLYAADFHHGTIEVFDKTFAPVTLDGDFIDPHLPQDFEPFNIQNLDGKLYVTYARRAEGSDEVVTGQGLGLISVFDTEGQFLDRLVTRGMLNTPWGLAMAPDDFGRFGGHLLVGNLGDGRIHAFNPDTGGFRGTLKDPDGRQIRIDGLRGLAFGNGTTTGEDDKLYFTAGPDDGTHGIFGSLDATLANKHGHRKAIGADAGGGPHVKVFDDDKLEHNFFAFDEKFRGGVRVAVGDLNGDAIDDTVVTAGPSGGPHVKAFDGVDNSLMFSFFAYDERFRGGINVAVGDVDGDGFADIITGAETGGGPHVKVFSGVDASELASFFAFDENFRGGVRVAADDITADGLADIFAGAGIGGGPHIKIFDGKDGGLLDGFFAGNAGFRGGVFVAAGDLNDDGNADIIVGTGAGVNATIFVYTDLSGTPSLILHPFNSKFSGGARVAVRDLDDDGQADIMVGAGPSGSPEFRRGHGHSGNFDDAMFAFDKGFRGGIFVG